MRPPWIEASALLGAHGHRADPGPLPPLDPLAEDVRFALYRRVGRREKPTVYADLPALCRALHRGRAGRPIRLEEAELDILGRGAPLAGVSVWLTTDDGAAGSNAGDYLGFAWLNGAGREALAQALRRAEPPRIPDWAFEAEAA